MKTMNPYAAPGPEAAWDVEVAVDRESWLEKNFLWLLFSVKGRIPRSAYWAANLIVTIVYYAAKFTAAKFIKDTEVVDLVGGVLALPMLWSSIAIQAKRWHDRDKSGWRFFILFIPLVGPIWTFIELGFCRGTDGPNSYGKET
jgi:uncharacterized membrane protein YhaH (DUF805 family)